MSTALALQLLESCVRDAQVVCDLVSKRLADGGPETFWRTIGTHERPPEEGDLAGSGGCICRVGGPWHALIQPVQAPGVHRRQLGRARLLGDDDRHGSELTPERLGQLCDRLVKRRLERIDQVHDVHARNGGRDRPTMPDTRRMSSSTPPSAAISMTGLVFKGPGQPLSIEQLRLDPPGPGEVRVRMVASGVCHSDLHVVDGDWVRPTDVVLGHEGAAIVESLGSEVTGLDLGDLVVLVWTAPCGMCAACRRQEPWLCATPRGGGHRRDADQVRVHRSDGSPVGVYSGVGSHATHQVVDAAAAIRIDPRTPHDVAALLGCAATTGIGAVRNTAGVRAGESVVVVGLGGVGLSAVMAAADARAGLVIAIDTQSDKLDLARQVGATHALAASDATAVQVEVRRLTGDGADHVLECIGLTATVETALSLARPGGTVTLVGMTPQADRAQVDVYRFVEDGTRLLGSNYGSVVPSRDIPRIATDVVHGRLPLGRLVTGHIALADIDDALESMRRRDGARRVITFEEEHRGFTSNDPDAVSHSLRAGDG